MDVSTLTEALESISDRDKVEARAKELGAYQRQSKVRTFDVVLALLRAPCVERKRTIASARRAWEMLTGRTVAESTFEDRFNPGLLRLHCEILRDAMAKSPRAARRQWPPELRQLRDILVCDGTQIALCDAMADTFASTTEGKAGLKLVGLYSLGEGAMKDVRMGAAVHHDRRLLRLGELTPGALYLLDLGFYDHDLFVAYDDADAYFVSRLKDNAVPLIKGFVQGVYDGRHAQGKRLDGELRYHRQVDVDVLLRVPTAPEGTHPFRVVKLDVPGRDRHGNVLPDAESTACWYVTNLPRETWSVAMISALYLLRWSIERIWRQAKHLARMDQLKSCRPVVIFTLLMSSLLLWAIGNRLAQELEYDLGIGMVSHDRVHACVVAMMADVTRLLRRSCGELKAYLAGRVRVLIHEGHHPNPAQPRRISAVLEVLQLHSDHARATA